MLLKNNNFVKLVNPSEPQHKQLSVQDVILGGTWLINGNKYEEQGHLFDHNFADDTITEEKTFVFIETDIDMIRQNIFIDFNLYIFIFTSKNLVRITDETIPSINDIEEMGYNAGHYGNRVDILCDVVDRILNGNTELKGISAVKPAEKGFCTLYSPNQKYYGKCLKYNISNYNEAEGIYGN